MDLFPFQPLVHQSLQNRCWKLCPGHLYRGPLVLPTWALASAGSAGSSLLGASSATLPHAGLGLLTSIVALPVAEGRVPECLVSKAHPPPGPRALPLGALRKRSLEPGGLCAGMPAERGQRAQEAGAEPKAPALRTHTHSASSSRARALADCLSCPPQTHHPSTRSLCLFPR